MAKLKELFEITRHPYTLAEMADLKVQDIRKAMQAADLAPLPGWGRVSIQHHIISRRMAYAPGWPIKDQAVILENKRLHDQGRVTMCQGRDDGFIIQYAIPSVTRIKRMPYFYGG